MSDNAANNLSYVRLVNIPSSYSGMNTRRNKTEVTMLKEMLKHYNETKSISEATDICELLTELYEVHRINASEQEHEEA